MRHNAFVLAAGFGTRLRPLTNHLPKPLVPVCGVPMLAYALALCRQHGLLDVVVNAHWKAETLQPWAGEHEGVKVTVSVEEPDILGTGGGLKKVERELADVFAVVNADVLCDVDLAALVAAVPHGGAAMALRPGPVDRYGHVGRDTTGIVVKLVDVASATASGEIEADTHFTGIHAMHVDALQQVPQGFSGIVRTAYKHLVPRREVASIRHTGLWLDVGDPAAYLDTNLAVLSGKARLALNPFERAAWARSGRGTWGSAAAASSALVIGDAWIGHGAQLNGASIENSVVGERAVVSPDAQLIDSVVWSDCAVPPGVHRRVVVHPGGVLALDDESA